MTVSVLLAPCSMCASTSLTATRRAISSARQHPWSATTSCSAGRAEARHFRLDERLSRRGRAASGEASRAGRLHPARDSPHQGCSAQATGLPRGRGRVGGLRGRAGARRPDGRRVRDVPRTWPTAVTRSRLPAAASPLTWLSVIEEVVGSDQLTPKSQNRRTERRLNGRIDQQDSDDRRILRR